MCNREQSYKINAYICKLTKEQLWLSIYYLHENIDQIPLEHL